METTTTLFAAHNHGPATAANGLATVGSSVLTSDQPIVCTNLPPNPTCNSRQTSSPDMMHRALCGTSFNS